MKKRYFLFIFFVLWGISVFGSNDKQEEVDFLLFLPNSSNRFVNEEQAFIQLNNLALYLSNKNLIPGQIIVCGYAAFAQNNIESVDLSRERALFVMDELHKRGISRDLFSEPVGYGSVYLWGDNANENDRKLNRRVRILLDDESPLFITQEMVNVEIETVNSGSVYEESGFKFPWLILPLLAVLAAIIFLLLVEWPRKPVYKDGTTNAQPQTPKTDTVPGPAPAAAVATSTMNLDEEIRLRAYELSQQHNERGDYRDQDWYNAVREISAWYTACGHSVFPDGGYWWASQAYGY
ncbi:MAG: DUF2934 domain-containing protein [Treponema sp.]|jgi:hypothetical protein|nr:DUF2934 domain-containing protein [Treponema sp.]